MTRKVHNPGAWPRQMRADTAAAYCDEASVEAFISSVGSLYPEAVKIPGKGKRWLRDDLDRAIDQNFEIDENLDLSECL